MTAVESRIAATLAEHRAQYEDYFFICDCGEKWPALAECLDEEVAAHERHVAAVIASSDDLAVIELPKPDEETDRHIAFGDFRRQGGWPATLDRRSGTVYFEDTDSGDSRNLRAASAVRYATNILAAARAAEAVSDR